MLFSLLFIINDRRNEGTRRLHTSKAMLCKHKLAGISKLPRKLKTNNYFFLLMGKLKNSGNSIFYHAVIERASILKTEF